VSLHIARNQYIHNVRYISEKILSPYSSQIPLTPVVFGSFTFLILDSELACGFFNDMSNTPAYDLPPKMVVFIPLVSEHPGLEFLLETDRNFLECVQIESCLIDENAVLAII
jgi:hypothetical protein